MSKERSISIIIILLLALTCVSTAHGQARRGRSTTAKNTRQESPAQGVAPRQSPDDFWAAQRSIEAAIQQLEAYLRESPTGERAATARRQIEALKGLSVSASLPEWAKMGQPYLRHVPVWRIASVDPQADRARLTVEIACERDDGGDCYFAPFDRSPLVLVDNAGRYYPMLEAGDLPQDVRPNRDAARDGTVAVSGGRTISVRVDFAPLSAGAVTGQVYYRDRNTAQPARFSLARRK
jgi:hypothetical protein